jgi:nucleoside-diphosphate-sugar epimerase
MTGAPLTVYGDGSQTRSFCYVDDLVAGVLAMAELRGELGLPPHPSPGAAPRGRPR